MTDLRVGGGRPLHAVRRHKPVNDGGQRLSAVDKALSGDRPRLAHSPSSCVGVLSRGESTDVDGYGFYQMPVVFLSPSNGRNGFMTFQKVRQGTGRRRAVRRKVQFFGWSREETADGFDPASQSETGGLLFNHRPRRHPSLQKRQVYSYGSGWTAPLTCTTNAARDRHRMSDSLLSVAREVLPR